MCLHILVHAQCIILFESGSYSCVSVVTYSTFIHTVHNMYFLTRVSMWYVHVHMYVRMCTSLQSELTDSPEVYDKFLKVLMDSDDSGLTPVEVCAVYSVHVYTMHTYSHILLILCLYTSAYIS